MQGHMAAYYAHLVIMRQAATLGISPPPQEASSSFYGIFPAPRDTSPIATAASAASEWLWGRGPPKPFTIDAELQFDQDLEEAIKSIAVDDDWEPPSGMIPTMGRWWRAQRRRRLQRLLEQNVAKGLKKNTPAPAPVAALGLLPWLWLQCWVAGENLLLALRDGKLWSRLRGGLVAAAGAVWASMVAMVAALLWLLSGVWYHGLVKGLKRARERASFNMEVLVLNVVMFRAGVSSSCSSLWQWLSCQGSRAGDAGDDAPVTGRDLLESQLQLEDPAHAWLHKMITGDASEIEGDEAELKALQRDVKKRWWKRWWAVKFKGSQRQQKERPGRVTWQDAVARAKLYAGKAFIKKNVTGIPVKPPKLKEPKPIGRADDTAQWRQPPYKWPEGKDCRDCTRQAA
jgi:hypothetical protein